MYGTSKSQSDIANGAKPPPRFSMTRRRPRLTGNALLPGKETSVTVNSVAPVERLTDSPNNPELSAVTASPDFTSFVYSSAAFNDPTEPSEVSDDVEVEVSTSLR